MSKIRLDAYIIIHCFTLHCIGEIIIIITIDQSSNYDLWLHDCIVICVTNNDDLENYNWIRCQLNDYEKRIRDTEEGFLIEDYEVFQIIKNKSWYLYSFKLPIFIKFRFKKSWVFVMNQMCVS